MITSGTRMQQLLLYDGGGKLCFPIVVALLRVGLRDNPDWWFVATIFSRRKKWFPKESLGRELTSRYVLILDFHLPSTF